MDLCADSDNTMANLDRDLDSDSEKANMTPKTNEEFGPESQSCLESIPVSADKRSNRRLLLRSFKERVGKAISKLLNDISFAVTGKLKEAPTITLSIPKVRLFSST